MVQKWIWLALALVVGVAGAVWAFSLPAVSTATRSARLAAPVEQVFARVTAAADQAAWRSDVKAVKAAPDGRRWTETTTQGVAIEFEEVEKAAPSRYVIRFASPQGFTGEWVGEFAPAGDAHTEVRFTETVRVDSRIGRVLARLFAPPGAHIERYLADLRGAVEGN